MSLPDHDKLVDLLKSDPAAFEIERNKLIESEINKAPKKNQAALRESQSDLDEKLKKQT